MRYLITGGGIAAVQCVEELARLCPDDEIILISSTRVIKGVVNTRKLSRSVEEFEVVEKDLHSLPFPNVSAQEGLVEAVNASEKTITLASGTAISYDKLCICTGAKPKRLANGPHVLVLRDQDTIEHLAERLHTARRVVLIGNGGIALELAYLLQGVELTWVTKHSHIGDAFFDWDAAAFLQSQLKRSRDPSKSGGDHRNRESRQHRRQPTAGNVRGPANVQVAKGHPGFGHAVGPQWAANLPYIESSGSLKLESCCSVNSISEGSDEWPVVVALSNGTSIEADFVISAVGVVPNTDWLQGVLELHPEDKGILVDREMQSSAKDVYAAGDACCIAWPDLSQQWFQMRLWTQAKVMGSYAAHCMANTPEKEALSFSFELFTHATRFLGMKVVLLGLYNGQNVLETQAGELVSYCRCNEEPGGHFVRVLLQNHRMIGAVLIGETGLEEAFENLILDGLDISSYGPAILDPDVELDNIFD